MIKKKNLVIILTAILIAAECCSINEEQDIVKDFYEKFI